MFRYCSRLKIKWARKIGSDFLISFRHSLVSGSITCTASEQLHLKAVSQAIIENAGMTSNFFFIPLKKSKNLKIKCVSYVYEIKSFLRF